MFNEKSRNILIADNDEDVLLAFERTLENEGFRTAVTVTGEGVFRTLSTGHFDLLVLDDALSDTHCTQVLSDCHRAHMKPMVVVTYHQFPSRAEREQLEAMGVNTLVNKRDPVGLVQAVRHLLQPSRGSAEDFGALT